MLDIIQYDKIEKKNILESTTFAPLDAHQSLVHTLDMIDFMIALNGRIEPLEDDSTDWIILEQERE